MRIKKFSQKHIKTLRELGVETIYLFGSHAKGNPGPMSDVDIGIVFSAPEKYKGKTMDAYIKIYDIFQDVLPKNLKLKILFLQSISYAEQYKIAMDGTMLYERTHCSSANFQIAAMGMHFDFQFKMENIFKNRKNLA